MADLPVTSELRRAGTWSGPAGTHVALTYEDRYFRRRRIVAADGGAFVAAFDQVTNLDAGDALVRPDGVLVEIRPAAEDLLAVSGDDLVRLAWHIGNRHTPCQIESGRLLIRRDPVIGHMLEHLGARISQVTEPFTPEGGAYGPGRTHAHEHGHTAHSHTHSHVRGETHSVSHSSSHTHIHSHTHAGSGEAADG